MTQEEYREFRHKAREPKLLYAAIQNSRDPPMDPKSMVDVVMPATEVERANLVFQKMMYQQPESPRRSSRNGSGNRRRNLERQKKIPGRDAPRAIPAPALLCTPGARRGRRVMIGPPLRAACRTIAHSWRNSGGAPRPGRKPRRVPRPDNWVLFGESAGYSGPVQVWLRY